ncbi:MAG TPA: PIN domain-containing protein [Stellaceae bacterium]|nr:PIN domain-containing protein [Stellaceae bacterium]
MRPTIARSVARTEELSPLHFLDTNILLYSISREPGEAVKRDRAIDLLARDDGALSVQVLQEFYVQATRPNRPVPLPHEIAAGLIRTWTRFRVQEIDLDILSAALEIKATHRFSYWDSAIIAAARALGCRELYSEDMAHGRRIGSTTIINPFR